MLKEHQKFRIPEYCDNCASTSVVYTDNSAIYGRNFGDWPKCYLCLDCRASVGCHPNTNVPLGIMADKETKTLRKLAHASFDELWRNGYMNRSQAYHWLARTLGIHFAACHISQLSKEQLRKAEEVSREYLLNNLKSLEKRKEKRNVKYADKQEREFKRTKRHIRARNR